MKNWDKIAKIGSYTDMRGIGFTFTKDVMDKIAANYATAEEKAPLVFGHPQTDSPAQGWIKGLRVNGDYLEAQYENVTDEAKSGQYRYKSVSIDPANLRIKHVGLLGGVAPAISGLGEVSFSCGDEITLFYGYPQKNHAFSEGISEGGGSWKGGNLVPPSSSLLTLNFSENTGDQNMDKDALALLTELQAKVAEKEKEIADLKSQLEELAKKAGAAEAKVAESEANFAKFRNDVTVKMRTDRINALVASGKIAPAEREKHLQFATALGQTATLNFAANGGGISSEALRHKVNVAGFTPAECDLEEQYLRDLEAKDTSAMFSEFTPPKDQDQAKPTPSMAKNL